jgi:hypothetical protein
MTDAGNVENNMTLNLKQIEKEEELVNEQEYLLRTGCNGSYYFQIGIWEKYWRSFSTEHSELEFCEVEVFELSRFQ